MSFDEEFLLKQANVYKGLEEEAEMMYKEIISKIKDKEIIDILDKIRRDEVRHQKVVSEIIGILESNFPDKLSVVR
ncbi:hypothetical protein JW766_05480 [Candidatus Dojkabacteria bacterium]|nr:hypothetical protein [Candidatus Dojkabacteria bacterium]